MKKYIPHIVVLIVGIVIGALCREHHFRNIVDNPQRDTVFVHDTTEYTKEVLAESTKVVHQKDTEYIYIEVRDTIVKEKKVYVPMPMQHYRTRVKDAEIFHSGIESRIDSLNIFSTTANITQTYLPKEKKNYLALGIEASYIDRLYIPIYFQYSRMLHKNIEIYGKVMYDLSTRLWGVGIGTNVQFGW